MLIFLNGSRVNTPAAWSARRAELSTLVQEHILGTLPPTLPTLLAAKVLNTSTSDTLCGSFVRLDFRANVSNVAFDIELAWRCSATGSLPVFLTQYNHRGWAMAGAQRGYLTVLYPGGDTRDASGAFRTAYPQASMRKILGRAFVASRAIDFLTNTSAYAAAGHLPPVDTARVSISGHSRNGKQSLVAAAFDERIASVVGSSPGTPISSPIRFSSPDFNGEPVLYDTTKRDWFLESLHDYYGREHAVPADGHMILALIAPRRALIATADSDASGDVTFAVERCVRAALPAFGLAGAPEALRVRYRSGRHHGFLDVQSYFDWFDQDAGAHTSGATTLPGRFYPPHPLHVFEWADWRASTPPPPPPPPPSAPLASRVTWLLGGASAISIGATGGLHGATHYCESGDEGTAYEYAASMMEHDQLPRCVGTACKHDVVRHSLSFGAYVTANLYVPQHTTGDPPPALPVVIFLPGHSYHMGFTGTYNHLKSAVQGGLVDAIAARGVAVLAWDGSGMGMRQRIDGAPRFYERHPTGSRLGAMIGEVQAALDMIHCASPQAGAECADGEGHTPTYPKVNLPPLNPARVFIVGYSLGASVALHSAALATPARPIAGVAAFSGWTPWRTGGGGDATGGLRLLYETVALVPRLGLFEEDPKSVPYDYDELIASLAPRPLLLYAPGGNRFAVPADVAAAIRTANASWVSKGAATRFEAHTPPDGVSEMRDTEIGVALEWVERVVLPGPAGQ